MFQIRERRHSRNWKRIRTRGIPASELLIADRR